MIIVKYIPGGQIMRKISKHLPSKPDSETSKKKQKYAILGIKNLQYKYRYQWG